MKVFDSFPQGSLEWLAVRSGVVTASEIDALVSPKWEVRKGKGVTTYVAQKAAERWLGASLPGYQTLDMEYGEILEKEALPSLAFDYGWKITRPAFILADDERLGCSPDGMLDTGIGIEIKCPNPLNHVKYLLDNTVPDDYASQVQFSMYVTGATRWWFVSYRRGFPTLALLVDQDRTAQNAILNALHVFFPRLEQAWEDLTRLNGGIAPRRNPFRETLLAQKPATAPQPSIDIIP